jgi:hypothetical protein
MEKMNVEIQLMDEDTKEDAWRLIIDIMETCGDSGFSISSVYIDETKVFSVDSGFDRDFIAKENKE